MEIEPSKCFVIQGIDNYETYKINENTIGIRPIWYDAKTNPPPAMQDVLLYANVRSDYIERMSGM